MPGAKVRLNGVGLESRGGVAAVVRSGLVLGDLRVKDGAAVEEGEEAFGDLVGGRCPCGPRPLI